MNPALESLESDAGKKSPGEDNTILGRIAFLLHHESYDIGQLGLWRKQLGTRP